MTSLININKNLFSGLIFLNLQKAFDAVSHYILLHKLVHYGIRGPAHFLLQSYLRRKQFVSIYNVNSKIESKSHGSTLDHLLFLNDLLSSTNILLRLFADDTCLIIKSRNEKLLETEMNKNLSNVFNWYCGSKLRLNPKKSYYTISPKSNVKFPQISLTMNDSTVYPQTDVKYPSVLIDTQLNFLISNQSNKKFEDQLELF